VTASSTTECPAHISNPDLYPLPYPRTPTITRECNTGKRHLNAVLRRRDTHKCARNTIRRPCLSVVWTLRRWMRWRRRCYRRGEHGEYRDTPIRAFHLVVRWRLHTNNGIFSGSSSTIRPETASKYWPKAPKAWLNCAMLPKITTMERELLPALPVRYMA
jgi:hypothetical protein